MEKCTEDDDENPPLVLAARYLPKFLFEKETTKEPTPERDEAAKQPSKHPPVSKTRSKEESKPDDSPGRGSLHGRAPTAGKDVKPKKEKIIAEKGKTGKIDTFHVLLQYNVNVNSKNEAGVTALHTACERGIIAMVKELILIKGIKINQKDGQKNTPLHTACESGEKDVTIALIEAGAHVMEKNSDKMTPLHVAVVEQKLEIVEMLLDKCAGDKEELLQAVEKDGNSAFLLAVKSGNEEMVKFFLDNGVKVTDQNGNRANALHLASSLKIMELVFDAEGGKDLLDQKDWNDRTPLHYAAKHNQISTLKFLLEK